MVVSLDDAGTSLVFDLLENMYDGIDCSGPVVATGRYAKPESLARYVSYIANAIYNDPWKVSGRNESGNVSIDVMTGNNLGQPIVFTGSGVKAAPTATDVRWTIAVRGGKEEFFRGTASTESQSLYLALRGKQLDTFLLAEGASGSFNLARRFVGR